MITVLFFAILIGCLAAMVYGTLADEINGLLRRVIDHFHPDEQHNKMLELYMDALKR